MHICVPLGCLVPSEAKKTLDPLKLGVTGGCEPPYGCWASNQVLGKSSLYTFLLIHLSSVGQFLRPLSMLASAITTVYHQDHHGQR